MEEPVVDDGVEMELLSKRKKRVIGTMFPVHVKVPSARRRSTLGVLCVVFTVLTLTGAAVWALSRRYDVSNLQHTDIENAEWLKVIAAWKPIADGVVETMDPSVDVCEDAYQWACGSWLASHSIPYGGSYLSKAITAIRDNHNKILEHVVKEDWPMISPYYTSCNSSWEKLEFDHVVELYDEIRNSSSKLELFELLGKTRYKHGLSLAGFAFRVSAQSDPYNSSARVVTFFEAENTLPSPVYYSSASRIDLQNYQRFIASMFSVSPDPINSEDAGGILDYETEIAEIMSIIATLGLEEEYSRKSYDLVKSTLGPNVVAYVEEFKLLKPEHLEGGVFVVPSNYFAALSELLEETPLSTLKNLALYSLFKETFPLLGPLYFNTYRELSSILAGTAVHSVTRHEREIHCIRSATSNMPMLMGHYYVNAAGIGEEYKQHLTELTQITRETFAKRLDGNTWMDTATKVAAERKMQEMTEQICYPDSWDSVLEFEQLLYHSFDPEDYFDNTIRIYKVNDKIEFDSVLKLTSRNEWSFDFVKYAVESPEIVNAFYSPSLNRITIAAGMTQPPFIYDYDWRGAPLPSTFGGIVTIIGHEITHGFDNEGALFNSVGELDNWWSDVSKRQFSIDAQCIAASRSRVETQIPGVYLDGNRVLGESIADLGGIETALDAMDEWESLMLSDEEKKMYDAALYEIFPTLNKRQLFFLFFIQNYCELQTDDSVYDQVVSDPHPPGRQRVNALLADVPRFSEAFNCKTGTRYNPPDRCVIW